MGDVKELGKILADAFASPDSIRKDDFLSFSGIVDTLNQPGHHVTFDRFHAAPLQFSS